MGAMKIKNIDQKKVHDIIERNGIGNGPINARFSRTLRVARKVKVQKDFTPIDAHLATMAVLLEALRDLLRHGITSSSQIATVSRGSQLRACLNGSV